MIEEFLPLFSVLAETGGNELADRLRGVLNTVAEKVNIALAALIEDGLKYFNYFRKLINC